MFECLGSIYESEIGSYSNWRRIWELTVRYDPIQVCLYNKEEIWVSTTSGSAIEYYCFNLNRKIAIDVAYYGDYVSLRRVDNKIEVIECNVQNFKLDSYYLDKWNLKGNTLHDLGENLWKIDYYDKEIKLDPNNANFYDKKGKALYALERYLEAIECYDQAIKLYPDEDILYNNKGNALYALERYLEAIQCYDEAIRLDKNNADFYYCKGNAFMKLERYLEAINCYDEAIELNPNDDADFHYNKGNALNELGRYPEALKSYEKAIEINPKEARFYKCKGNILRQVALQDFNMVNNLKEENQENGVFTEDEWDLSEFINDALLR